MNTGDAHASLDPVLDDRALVFTGGDPPRPSVADRLPTAALVIAADSGLHHALTLDRRVDVVVGDLDSVAPEVLAAARAAGTEVQEHPAAKDATDLELALDLARARGAHGVTVVGGSGGRIDHFLANALVLGSTRYAALTLDAWMGSAYVQVARDRTRLLGAPGSRVSLLPLGGSARVTTNGLRYPLHDEVLEPGTTRGISNELVGPEADVVISDGTVLVVQPDVLHSNPQ